MPKGCRRRDSSNCTRVAFHSIDEDHRKAAIPNRDSRCRLLQFEQRLAAYHGTAFRECVHGVNQQAIVLGVGADDADRLASQAVLCREAVR